MSMPDMEYVCLAGSILLAVIAVYLFLIFPGNGKKAKVFDGRYIAHRGLHGGERIENSLDAFRAAISKGVGVELDIQLSADRIPVVCHDYDLKRVFGVDQRVSDMTADALRAVGVPCLREVLTVLDGKVPLVAEIKGETFDTEVCEKAAVLLDAYDGLYCVESFNPVHLGWFRKHRPQVIRGQLSTAFGKKPGDKRTPLHFVLRHLLLNVISRPHFIAYEYRYYGLSARLCAAFGALMVCWTPTSQEDVVLAKKHYTTFIFEGFEPDTE